MWVRVSWRAMPVVYAVAAAVAASRVIRTRAAHR
jgi:hypothetical protein